MPECDDMASLRAADGGSSRSYVAGQQVRRLMPVECERLMGWPDDWTRYKVGAKGEVVEQADGPRYKQCGNGVVAPVAAWIGRRIVDLEKAALMKDNTHVQKY